MVDCASVKISLWIDKWLCKDTNNYWTHSQKRNHWTPASARSQILKPFHFVNATRHGCFGFQIQVFSTTHRSNTMNYNQKKETLCSGYVVHSGTIDFKCFCGIRQEKFTCTNYTLFLQWKTIHTQRKLFYFSTAAYRTALPM